MVRVRIEDFKTNEIIEKETNSAIIAFIDGEGCRRHVHLNGACASDVAFLIANTMEVIDSIIEEHPSVRTKLREVYGKDDEDGKFV